MKKIWEIGIILFSVWGFWGMIYPDLCFTEDVCEIVADGSGIQNNIGNDSGAGISGGNPEDGGMDIFTGLCGAGPGRIRMKSRILEKLKPESNEGSHGANDEFSDE